jgi:anti-sigma B factor antagonist
MFRQHVVHSREGDLLCTPEQLVIRSERHGHAHVIQLVGELDVHTAAVFEDELKRVECTDAREIIVDLSGLTFIGSDGLKVFIHANARSRCDGNRLRLTPGPERVQTTFETTGLLSRLPFTAAGAGSLVQGPLSRVQVVVSRPVQDWTGSTR